MRTDTKLVKLKKGGGPARLVNVSDYDPKLHEEVIPKRGPGRPPKQEDKPEDPKKPEK